MSAKRYDDEFRGNAIKLVKNGRSVLSVAKDLGIAEMTLRKWLASDKEPQDDKDRKIAELEAENRRLSKKLKETEETADILKKSLGIFIKT